MASNSSNKLLPFLAIFFFFVIVGGFFIFKNTGLGQMGMDFFSVKSNKPKEVVVDGDSALNTLDTIAVDSTEIKKQYRGVKEDIKSQSKAIDGVNDTVKQLSKTNELLRKQLETQSLKLDSIAKESASKTFDMEKVKKELMDSLKDVLPSTSPYQVNETKDDPVETPVIENENYDTSHSINVTTSSDGSISYKIPKTPIDNIETSDKDSNAPIIDPRYTIFANSILYDSVAVTTLIGRIPRQGVVGDAAPFKVLIGAENLAANGFSVPGLKGMIMSGTVFGDSTLSCIRGEIYSATYIFEDGRGIVFPKGGKRSRKKEDAIGWISDEFGNPCVPGRYISNKKTQLKNNILAQMAAGFAGAYSEAEVTTLTNDKGGTSRVVTGNSAKYALGTAISAGTKELIDYMKANSFDYWDAVVLPSGKRLAVHIDTTLELDNSSLLRKVIYDKNTAEYGLTD